MAKTQEVYVAFSIHGTNAFITATNQIDPKNAKFPLKIGDFTFSKGRSRDVPKNNAIKLLWSDLEESGRPLTDPQKVWDAFQMLAQAGWMVRDTDFVRRHKIDLRLQPVAKPSKAPVTIQKPAIDPMAAKMANATGAVPAKMGGSLSMPSNDPRLAELDKPLPEIKIGDDGFVRGTMNYAGTETGRFEKAVTETDPSGDPDRGVVKNMEGLKTENPGEELCEDEGCPHHGTPHVCNTTVASSDDKILPEPGSVDDGSRESNEAERMIVRETEMKNDLANRLIWIHNDITALDVDVIVNAANAQMIPGGGVDGAINKAAGKRLGDAMRAIGRCDTGQAVITDGFNLKANHVVHAVGPIYKDYTDADAARLLASAYSNAFLMAAHANAQTIAAPLLSTGVYGYPVDKACAIAVREAYTFLQRFPNCVITLVAYDQTIFETLVAQENQVYHELQLTRSDDLPQVASPHN